MKLEYYQLTGYIESKYTRIRNYKIVSKELPKVKFIKNSRNKKCRGYHRKLYKALIPIYSTYNEVSYILYEFMHELDNKEEMNEFSSEVIKPFNIYVANLYLKLSHDLVNNRCRITSKTRSYHEYKVSKYKFSRDKNYISYDLLAKDRYDIKLIEVGTDKKWKCVIIYD